MEPPAPTENAEWDEAGHHEPARTEDGGAHTPEAGRGAGTGVIQEAVTTPILNAPSNPEVVCSSTIFLVPVG